MPDPQTNPFASYGPEDQAAIREQLVNMSSSGQLNEAQKKSVALALTQMGAASGFPSQTMSDNPAPEPPSLMDKANTGLVSPDLILKLANLPQKASNLITGQTTPAPTVANFMKSAQGNPADSPVKNALVSSLSGATADTANAISGFTSPVSLATAGLSKVAAGTGAAAKLAKALLTATGLTFGATGVGNTVEGIGKGVTTPEGAQETLGGLAQVAGAAPAGAEMGAVMKGAAAHVIPQAFSEGRDALVQALKPDRKLIPALRNAYDTVGPQLAGAPVKDLPDLESFASMKRVDAANQLKTELSKVNPQATQIDPMAVYRSIRSQITRAMELGSPAEANAIAQYADRVRDDLTKNPVDISQAEQLSQQITARTAAFDRMTPDAKRQAGAVGDPNAGEKAFKQSLQDQIEAKLAGYKNLKAQYGSWKELQNQTQNRMDAVAKDGPSPTWMQRRSIEGILGLGGAAFGYMHGGTEGGAGGGLLGYMAGRAAADAYLDRLASPERTMQRAINPQVKPPIPFMGQVVQPVAQSIVQGGGGGMAF